MSTNWWINSWNVSNFQKKKCKQTAYKKSKICKQIADKDQKCKQTAEKCKQSENDNKLNCFQNR